MTAPLTHRSSFLHMCLIGKWHGVVAPGQSSYQTTRRYVSYIWFPHAFQTHDLPARCCWSISQHGLQEMELYFNTSLYVFPYIDTICLLFNLASYNSVKALWYAPYLQLIKPYHEFFINFVRQICTNLPSTRIISNKCIFFMKNPTCYNHYLQEMVSFISKFSTGKHCNQYYQLA